MKYRKIFILGLPGSGKTTAGKKLADDARMTFMDLDEYIIEAGGRSIPEIFEKDGEDIFRILERDQLRLIVSKKMDFILSTGGGTPCFFDNMDQMNDSGITVFLDVPMEEIRKRLSQNSSRPLMKTHTLEDLYATRSKWYQQANIKAGSDENLLKQILKYQTKGN